MTPRDRGAAPVRRRATSVRLRLALQHAALLGGLVVGLAAVGIAYAERTLRAQVDAELAETARLLADVLAQEVAATRAAGAGADAVHRDAVRALRAGRLDVLLVDPAARRLVARAEPLPRDAGAAPADDARVAGPARAAPRLPTLLGAALAAGARFDLALFSVGDVASADEQRVAALPVRLPGAAADERLLVVVRDLDDVRAVQRRLWTALAVALPGVLLLAFAGGLLLARRSLAPLEGLRAQAARISASTPTARLVPRDPDDELGRLADVFNQLLDRLARTLDEQRQFMADASHELRTPAAVVRAAADVALRRDDRSAAEYRQALEIARAEADRLAHIVDDLFLLARADVEPGALRAAPFDLGEALEACWRAMRAVAEERGVALRLELGDPRAQAAGVDPFPDGAPMQGDEQLVRRLVLNLLDNALKFTPRGGRVTLRLAADELAADAAARAPLGGGPARLRAAWRVEVEDTGPGVPAEARLRIFDRFYRGEARGGADALARRAGAGLGLAMARTIAEAHGGVLELARSDGSGSLFMAVLPREPG